MPLQATQFLGLFRNYRMCYLTGRYGGGKTSCMVALAGAVLEAGWVEHAVGNFPAVWFEDPNCIPMENTILCLDEAGVWLSDKEFDKLTAFLRKKNLYIIMATVIPPPLRAKVLIAQRTMNWRTMGINAWSYNGLLTSGVIKEKCNFLWRNPTEIFGLYDTSYVADDDCGLLDWVKDGFEADREKRLQQGWFRYVKRDREASATLSNGEWLPALEDGRGTAWAFSEAAETLASAVSVPRRKGGFGRR